MFGVFPRSNRSAFLLLAIIGVLVSSTAFAAPGINPEIPFHGVLKDDTGTPLSGSYDMSFTIYDAPSGGSALWTGLYTVTVTDGTFKVMLGSGGSSFGALDFTDDTYYIGLTVESDPEMTPRQRIGASAYAFNADKLDGYDSSDFLNLSASTSMATTSATTLFTLNQSGSGDVLNLLNGATNLFTVTSSGNVGIGTSSPAYTLSVVGDANISAGSAYKLNGVNLAWGSTTLESYYFGGAGNFGATSTSNTALGHNALASSTGGTHNVAIGWHALMKDVNTTYTGNVAVGSLAMENNLTGIYNTAVGAGTLYNNTTGNSNSAFGTWTLFSNTTGYWNSAFGFDAANGNTTGYFNNAFGYRALYTNRIGANNVAIGNASMFFATSSYNTAVGVETLRVLTTGGNHTAMGYRALYNITTGTSSIALGYQAGNNITTGSKNIVIGYDIDAPSATGNNQLNIGNLIFGTGLTGTGQTAAGSLGIGTSSPWAKLSIQDNYGAQQALFDIATTTSSSYATSSLFRVNASGKVGVGTSTPKASLQVGNTGGIFTSTSAGNLDLARNAYYDATAGQWKRIIADDTATMMELQQPGSNHIAFYYASDGNATADSAITWTQMLGMVSTGVFAPGKITAGIAGLGGSTLSARGNASIGSTFYSTAAPTNGLIVEGNVGVGTTSPSSLLTVANTVSTTAGTPLLTIASTTGGTATSTLMTVLANGQIRMGKNTDITPPFFGDSSNIVMSYTNTDPSGYPSNVPILLNGYMKAEATADSDANYRAGYFEVDLAGTANYNQSGTGISAVATANTTGTIVALGSVDSSVYNASASAIDSLSSYSSYIESDTGTTTNMYGLYHSVYLSNSTTTNSYGIYLYDAFADNARLTNQYGLYIEDQTAGFAENYAIYSAGGKSYFGGNVGVGTTTPTSALTFASSTTAEGGITMGDVNLFRVSSNLLATGLDDSFLVFGSLVVGNALQVPTIFGSSSPNGTLSLVGTSDATAGNIYLNPTGGNVGIGTTTPTATLTASGTIRFSSFGAGALESDALGNITVSSDERLKDIEGPFTRGLEALTTIEPILYHWNKGSGYDTATLYAGFSAQDIQEAIPEAVGTSTNGFLSLSERPILATVVNAVKELYAKMEEYFARTEALEAENVELKARVEALEEILDVSVPEMSGGGGSTESETPAEPEPTTEESAPEEVTGGSASEELVTEEPEPTPPTEEVPVEEPTEAPAPEPAPEVTEPTTP